MPAIHGHRGRTGAPPTGSGEVVAHPRPGLLAARAESTEFVGLIRSLFGLRVAAAFENPPPAPVAGPIDGA